MQYTLTRGATLVALTALAGACSSNPSPTPTLDAGMEVTVSPDVPLADVTVDVVTDRPRTDVTDGGGNTCNRSPIENLNTLGMLAGETTRYTGSNSTAPASESQGIQVPDYAMSVCPFTTLHQRVFSYTTRTTASIRVSTSNMGTEAGFDTTLMVIQQRVCTATPRPFFCNDDDASLPAGMTRPTSALITPVIPMGTTILIGVGGFDVAMGAPTTSTGTFELSVQELAPVAMGAPCDTRRIATGGCADATTCVQSTLLGNTGTCRAIGSTPGAACNAGSCDVGLACDLTRGTCYRIQPNGMGCDRFSDGWERCGESATCVNLQLGSIRGVCQANGSAAGGTCDAAGTCAAGMNISCASSASGGTCLNTALSHGPCSTNSSRCPTGETCVQNLPGVVQGTCRDNGTVAGSQCNMGACSGTGLTCNTTSMVCLASASAGEVCAPFATCRVGPCFFTDLADRFRGRCFTEGVQSGACRLSAPFCDAGLICTVAMPAAGTAGRCLRESAVGAACDFFSARCATGNTCVHGAAGTPPNSGTCAVNGSRAGTPCRTTGARCDTGLTCTTTRGAGTCYGPATTDCSPRYNDMHCPMGQSCRATTLDTGTCQMPLAESMDPNDTVAMPQSVAALPASVAGALSRFDTDCYGFDVPAMGRVFARANFASGSCSSGSLALDLYGPMGLYLGSATSSGAFGCPMIDGSYGAMAPLFPFARDLAMGRYTVCVRNPATGRPAVNDYVLDLNATAGM